MTARRTVSPVTRRRIGAAILCLAVAGAGVLTGATLASRSAHQPTYSGHTSQRPGRFGPQRLADNHVSFTVSSGDVRNFTVSWLAPCRDGFGPTAPLIDRSAFDSLPLRDGRFSIRNGGYQSFPGPEQRANVKLQLEGSVRGGWATGTLSVSAAIVVDDSYGADDCATVSPIHWRAKLTRS